MDKESSFNIKKGLWRCWGGGEGLKFCECVFFCARTIIFQRENLNNLIVCFTQCTLFFQYVWFLLPICLLCLICAMHVTRINAVSWQIARQTFWSRRLACLRSNVLRAYCNFESKLSISIGRCPNRVIEIGWHIFHFKEEKNKFLLQKVLITCSVEAIIILRPIKRDRPP